MGLGLPLLHFFLLKGKERAIETPTYSPKLFYFQSNYLHRQVWILIDKIEVPFMRKKNINMIGAKNMAK